MTQQESRPSLSGSGPWDLPIKGFEVNHITFGGQIDIAAYGEGGGRSEAGLLIAAPSAQIRLEGDFELVEPSGEVLCLDISKQEWGAFVPLFALRKDRIASAVATEDAQLEVWLTQGRGLRVGPHPMYENWELSGPGFRLIAKPGGGVAVFPG